MKHRDTAFVFLNVGHFLDHFFILIYATAAALTLTKTWGVSYAELVSYATPGFIAFGVGSIPAGWLADRWSREGMLVVFFIGLGLSSVLAGFSNGPITLAVWLTFIGLFSSIYHPVGLAMIVHGRSKTGVALAINGVFGNLGVACAALVTGFFITLVSWRAAFIVPGILCCIIGIAYMVFIAKTPQADRYHNEVDHDAEPPPSKMSPVFMRTFTIVLITTAIAGFTFQGTTFTLPKVFSERLGDIASSADLIGSLTFIVFAMAAFAQLVVGFFIDRYQARYVFATLAFTQAILFAVMVPLTGLPALLVSAAFMFVVFGQVPINDVLIGRIAHSQWRSRVYAIRAMVTFGVQALTLPTIAWVYSASGFSALFWLLSIASLMVFAVVWFLPKGDVGRTS